MIVSCCLRVVIARTDKSDEQRAYYNIFTTRLVLSVYFFFPNTRLVGYNKIQSAVVLLFDIRVREMNLRTTWAFANVILKYYCFDFNPTSPIHNSSQTSKVLVTESIMLPIFESDSFVSNINNKIII